MKLRHRYSLSIFLIGVVCVVAMVADRATSTKALLGERAAARAEALASAVAREVVKPMDRGDSRTVHERLRLFTELNGVERIQILDARGRAMFTAGRRFGRSDEDALKRSFREMFAGPGDEPLTVEVLISSEGYRRALLPVLARGVLWGSFSIALLALASWWLGNLAGRKIDSLIDAVTMIDRGSSITLPDLTRNSEIGALSRAFQELRRRLKDESALRRRSEEQRDDMSHMLVHDMKQPLTIFRIAMAALNDAGLSSHSREVKTALSLANRSTARMEAMVDGVLQTARMQNAAEPPERVRTRVADLVEEVSAEGALIAKSAGRPWRLDVAPDLRDRWILAHPAMLRRLVGNLVLNAFDHSPSGTPLALGARRPEQDPSSVEIYVVNDGSALEASPETFLQGERRTTGGASHAGLGLAFCRHAAKLHSGRLDARNLPDGRVEFFVTIPMGPGEASKATASKEAPDDETA